MRSPFLAAFAGAVLLAAGTARAADVPTDVSKTLAANYQLGCAAALDPTDDKLNALFALLAPDFVEIDFKGKTITRDESIANGKQQLKTIHTTSCDVTIDSQTRNADGTITVADTSHVAGTLAGPDGKSHDLVATSKAVDTWKQQTGGAWLQTQTKDVSALVKIDGVVVQNDGNGS
jgi:hypothetical protein